MAEASRKPVLDLATLVERPEIAIDGKRYEILSPDELSILDSQRFAAWGRDIDAMSKSSKFNDQLDQTVTAAARKVAVGVPEEVFARLSGAMKLMIVEVFTGLLVAGKMARAGAAADTIGGTAPTSRQTSRQTGAKSSRVSSASTAVRRTGGSKKRRQHS